MGDLLQNIMANAEVDEDKARQIRNAIAKAMRDALLAGDDVAINDFGKFKTYTRKARTINNPQTRQLVAYPAESKILFVPGQALFDALN